jgi:hypothetical protein
MKRRCTRTIPGNVPWPKLVCGRKFIIRDKNDSEVIIPVLLSKLYYGLNNVDRKDRIEYWCMRLPPGILMGRHIVATTDYLRQNDMINMLAAMQRTTGEDLHVVIGRKWYRINLPPFDKGDQIGDLEQ